MEVCSDKTFAEEPEEGEIIEDYLADVSGCSLPPGSPLNVGKSVPPPALSSAFCLSSIGRTESSNKRFNRQHTRARSVICYKQARRRICRKKLRLEQHTLKRKRDSRINHRRKSVAGINSDTDSETVDPKYAKHLQQALHHEPAQNVLHNSLRTRLKGLIGVCSLSDDKLNLTTLQDLALFPTSKNEQNAEEQTSNTTLKSVDVHRTGESELDQLELYKCDLDCLETEDTVGESVAENMDVDPELQELRFAALKSVVLKNHERRKRKATQSHNTSSGNGTSEINDVAKESDHSMIDNDLDGKCAKKCKFDVENNNGDTREIIKQQLDGSPNKVVENLNNAGNYIDSLEDDPDILRTMLLAAMSEKLIHRTVANVTVSTKSLEFPKPLETEKPSTHYNWINTNNIKPVVNANAKSRSKVLYKKPVLPTEVAVNSLIIRLGADSDSGTENNITPNETNQSLRTAVTEFLKKQRAEFEARSDISTHNSNSSTKKSDDSMMENSSVKLLPQSKQVEYRRLKQQLVNSQTKMRIRRASHKLSNSKEEAATNKKLPKPQTNCPSNTEACNSKMLKTTQEKKTKEPTFFQKLMSDLQIPKNGRLQINGKYRSLASPLHKLNQASTEKLNLEIQLQRLLQEINMMRKKLNISHINYNNFAQQMIDEKRDVDQRIARNPQVGVFTSTPNTCINSYVVQNQYISKENKDTSKSTKIVTTESTENEDQKQNIGSDKEQNVNVDIYPNQLSTEIKIDTENTQQEPLVYPNSATKEIVLQPSVEFSGVPKYVSPLANINNTNDAFKTLCPFNVFGVCKDKECEYVHYW